MTAANIKKLTNDVYDIAFMHRTNTTSEAGIEPEYDVDVLKRDLRAFFNTNNVSKKEM